MRDSFAYHGAVISAAMLVGWAITGQDSVPWIYTVLNLALGGREVIQLLNGTGSVSDLASGLLIPLPILILSVRLRV